jgi:trk system potassium uptake protein TrkH
MKKREILPKLSAILFYAALPLLIPVWFAYQAHEWVFWPMATSVVLMLLPSIPYIFNSLVSIFGSLSNKLIKLLFKKEIPWNYSVFVHAQKPEVPAMKFGDMMALTSLAWLIIPVITAYPYYALGFSPLNSIFESMSGWTSTGLSIIDNVDWLPKSFILFRSMTQWIGGLGIIILMLMIFKSRESENLMKSEGKQSIDLGIAQTAKSYWWIYVVLTALSTVILFLSGFDLFNAVNIAMAGLANGGWFPFTTYNFTELNKFVIALTMMMGATSFVLYKKVWSGNIKAFLSEEFLLFLSLIAISVALIFYVTGDDLHNSFFNVVSGFCSGGFSIGDLSIMHEFSKYVIVLLMVVGAMSCSTAGAIKLWRIEVALKSVLAKIKASFLPAGTVQVIHVDGVSVDSNEILSIMTFIFLYFMVFLVGSGALMSVGISAVSSMFVVASSMGNVGLSTISISALDSGSRVLLIILMYLGRIEILPMLALLRFLVKRK